MSDNEMTCAQLSGVAAELALGVLTGRERALAVAHLDNCDGCREEVRQLMETGEQLRELLPPADPAPGFETRVLERLGLALPASLESASLESASLESASLESASLESAGRAPAETGLAGTGPGGPEPATAAAPGPPARGHAKLLRAGRRDRRPAPQRPARDATRPGGTDGAAGPGRGAGTGLPPARPGPGRRLRRALAATALGLGVIAAGLGGWRIGASTSPSPATAAASAPLSSASLLSATNRSVGKIFLYSGSERWLYLSVDLGSGDETVTCQMIGTNGQVTTVGSFQLTGGYGGWGSPDPGNAGTLQGARLVAADGTVLASASFSRW